MKLVEHFVEGLTSPICLTWELTYACNLSCVHCLSSSGRRDPNELSTDEAKAVIDELQRMQVFYVNIGGGEPTVRSDFWELLDYAIAHDVGVKFSTNGVKLDKARAAQLAATDYVDVQISLDGATAEVNDHVRGPGSYATAIRAMENLYEAGFGQFKISVVVTRHNVDQLDDFKAIADRYGAQLRITRFRPSGRGADSWDELHPTREQQRQLYDWLVARGEDVLTGDSFFHLSAFGEELPGLNLCGAGRVVCLIDPVGDVYACPFAIHEQFLAGNVRSEGGFKTVWQDSELFAELRGPQSGGRVHEVLPLRRLPGRLHGREVLHRPAARRARPGVRARQRRARAGEAGDGHGHPQAVAGPLPPDQPAEEGRRRPGAAHACRCGVPAKILDRTERATPTPWPGRAPACPPASGWADRPPESTGRDRGGSPRATVGPTRAPPGPGSAHPSGDVRSSRRSDPSAPAGART